MSNSPFGGLASEWMTEPRYERISIRGNLVTYEMRGDYSKVHSSPVADGTRFPFDSCLQDDVFRSAGECLRPES